ncbi:polysaccharide deacetylase family protein [Dongia sedimenti]|uniref:Chitooligosaccharide deacetylase n=1 Tax=Dongia sedimenti TaxID=3064282 RepID=A0ABU0YNH2_9PROT|nr:polysaccharide deacetylase family protein [Rhodospirillaceae bacterium R-7]
MIPFRLSLGHWSPVIRRIDENGGDKRSIAITFDDGPDPASTPHLIAALAEAKAQATFFCCGVRVERHPELIAALVAAGHTVYAHGWDHQLYGAAQADEAMQAMARTEKLLARHRPTPATYLLRLPYNAGLRSTAIHRAMRRFHPNVQFAWWSHAIADYQIAGKLRAEAEVRRACAETTARLMECRDLDGGILLLHDAAITEPQDSAILATRLLLPGVLTALAERGLRGVALQPRKTTPAAARFIFRSAEPVTIQPRTVTA